MALPVDQLYRTNVVVRDLQASARQYAEFYGITRWQIAHHGDMVSATGSNAVEGLTWQLIQPLQRDESGDAFEGVHSICVTRIRPEELPALRAGFESVGVPVAKTRSLGDGIDAWYFDTAVVLGGFMLEVIVSQHEHWQAGLRSEETWDISAEVTRPHHLDFVRSTPGLNHFGVVVPGLQAVLPNYVRIFGTRRWRGYHWHAGEGSLEGPTYNGESVEHGFSTARGDVGRDRFGRGFGFEIVQPDFGPSHFEDFRAARGSGIHHLSLNFEMKDAYEWVEFQRWIATLGPVCMSGWLRDHSAMYIYSDLSARLGHVIESGIRRRSGHEPDRWYEFNEDGSILT